MKKYLLLFLTSLLCFAAIPAQAVQGIIQIGTSNVPISFLLTTTASNGQVGLTGQVAASAVTVNVNKPGSTSFVASTGTLVELGLGYYNYFPSATETASTGVLIIDVEDANAYAPSGGGLQVVAVNLNDAVALGLSKFSAVTLASAQAFNNTGQTTNYPTSGGGSVSDTSVQGDVTASLSGLGINSGWVTGLGTVNTDVPLIYSQTSAASQQANSAASLTTYGVATPATSATAIWAASTRTITGGSLTVAPPSASQIASVILSTPANLLNTDSSGRVPLQPTESFNNTGQTTNYPTSGGGGGGDPWATYLPGAYLPGQAGNTLGLLLGNIYSRL